MELQGLPAPGHLTIDISGTQQQQIWEEWVDTLETYFLAIGVQDTKRKKALLLYIGGDQLRTLYRTLDDPNDTFKSAVTVLSQHFTQKKNLAFERYKFRSASQLNGESMKCYITRLRDLSKHCKFDDYSISDAIMDQVIEKCWSGELRKKPLSESNLNVEKVICLATTREDVEKQVKVLERQEVIHEVKNYTNSSDNNSVVKGEESRRTGNYREFNQIRKTNTYLHITCY